MRMKHVIKSHRMPVPCARYPGKPTAPKSQLMWTSASPTEAVQFKQTCSNTALSTDSMAVLLLLTNLGRVEAKDTSCKHFDFGRSLSNPTYLSLGTRHCCLKAGRLSLHCWQRGAVAQALGQSSAARTPLPAWQILRPQSDSLASTFQVKGPFQHPSAIGDPGQLHAELANLQPATHDITGARSYEVNFHAGVLPKANLS